MAKPKQLRDAPNPLAPWFDAVVEVIGKATAYANRGRVASICKDMKAAGVDPATFAERYRAAMARYAGWRLAADISAVQTCWGWAVEPPKDDR
jgi:hypothetical protein